MERERDKKGGESMNEKVIFPKEREQEAGAALALFARADAQTQRDALAFIRGVQFAIAALNAREKGA